MGLRKVVVASAVSFLTVLSLFAVPVTALDHSEGDYWVYQGDMDYEGFSITGGYRYEYEMADSITLGSETYDVSVLKVTGSMTGETDDFLGLSASIEMVFDGYVYDVQGSMATVKEDMHTWANVSIDLSGEEVVARAEMHNTSEYSPPLLTGFVEGENGTGDEWQEATTIKVTSTLWVDDLLESTSTDDVSETYSVSIASAEEEVETDAGTFTCLKMTVTDSAGDFEVYWYSSDVGSWVKLSSYSAGDTTPYITLELTEYQYSGDSPGVMMILIGAGVLVLVLVVVVVLLFMRKKGQTPVQVPLQAPPPTT